MEYRLYQYRYIGWNIAIPYSVCKSSQKNSETLWSSIATVMTIHIHTMPIHHHSGTSSTSAKIAKLWYYSSEESHLRCEMRQNIIVSKEKCHSDTSKFVVSPKTYDFKRKKKWNQVKLIHYYFGHCVWQHP